MPIHVKNNAKDGIFYFKDLIYLKGSKKQRGKEGRTQGGRDVGREGRRKRGRGLERERETPRKKSFIHCFISPYSCNGQG